MPDLQDSFVPDSPDSTSRTGKNARRLTLLIAVLAWFAVILQLTISWSLMFATGQGWIAALLKPFTFFTMTTNLLIAIGYSCRLTTKPNFLHDKDRWAMVEGGLVSSIIFVAIAYQALSLRILRPIEGIEKISDGLLHYINPLLVLTHWLFFRERNRLKFSHPLRWFFYIIGYGVIALTYGHFWGTYPYPTLNAIKLGYAKLALNSLVLTGFWMLLAYAVVSYDRRRFWQKFPIESEPV